jgi:O-Antigen ligase
VRVVDSARPRHHDQPGISLRGPGGSYFWTAFWSVVAIWLPISEAQPTTAIWRLPLYRVEDLVVVGLLVSAISGRVARPVGLPVWIAGALAIPFAGFVSGNGSPFSPSVIVGVQFAVLCVLAPAVLRYHVVVNPYFLPSVLGAFVVTQTLSAATGIAQIAGAQVLGQSQLLDRSTGLAGHPNTLGIMCVIALLVIMAVMSKCAKWVQILLWCAFVVNLVALVATGSLSSLIAIGVGVVVFLLVTRRVLAALAVAVVAGVGAVMVDIDFGDLWIVAFLERRFASVTGNTLEGESSWEGRVRTYEWAVDHIVRDPAYGVGMDSANSGTYNGITAVHNYLLHSWYQGGLLLFVWFVAVTVTFLWCVGRGIKSSECSGAAAVIAAVIAFAMTSAFFVQQQHWLPLLLAVATIPTARSRDKGTAVQAKRSAYAFAVPPRRLG